MKHLRLAAALAATFTLASPVPGASQSRRALELADLHRLRGVQDPQITPDGRWVAFTTSEARLDHDEQSSDIWLVSWDGERRTRLTKTPLDSEDHPRFSPDGKRLAFLSSRGGSVAKASAAQLWVLDLAGGEAERVTDAPAGIEDFAWAPDGNRLVLVMEDPDTVEAGAADSTWRTTAPPIVIDRFWFKRDVTGYLARRRTHLYLLQLDTRVLEPLTVGEYDEVQPVWSLDGQYLAFVSKRGEDPDRNGNFDLYVMQAAPGAVPRRLTSWTGPDNEPDLESPLAWGGPDGRRIAYLQGGPDSLIYYALHEAAVINWAGGDPTVLAPGLDRNTERPRFSPDGRTVYAILETDGVRQLVRLPVAGGKPETIVGGKRVVADYAVSASGRVVVQASSPDRPDEIFAVEESGLRNLSRQNDSLLATLELAPVEEISVRSRDGTPVHGFLVRPLHYDSTRRYPTILRIHGGPVSQFEQTFDFVWQLLAANGYAVVAMNPRGSSGRGLQYSLGIWADWGNKDAEDVLAGVDYALKIGLADPDRLGVGGWSYGGMLTNYVIARDTRFKAAVSGAGISNILAGYGTDMYVREYEAELGRPWSNTSRWLRISAPFLHADRIKTPTLFMCGEKDFNVPLLNSEQMYQALRSLGVPTQLVIYPGQYHAINSPLYAEDRYRRWLEWYASYLKP